MLAALTQLTLHPVQIVGFFFVHGISYTPTDLSKLLFERRRLCGLRLSASVCVCLRLRKTFPVRERT